MLNFNDQSPIKVSIIGQGYVGLPLAVRLSTCVKEVIGFDIDAQRVSEILEGRVRTETISKEDLRQALISGAYRPTTDIEDLEGSQIIILAVPTPLTKKGQPDYSILLEATHNIARFVREGVLVISESTASTGTTRELIAPILLENGIKFEDMLLGCAPERIDPSNDNYFLVNTPRIVSGVNEKSTLAVKSFYEKFLTRVQVFSSVEIVEAAKLLENSFRLLNISFINEFSEYCNARDLDVYEVIRAASSKPFGFMAFYPGPGAGGHCIPVDPLYLLEDSKRNGIQLPLLESAIDSNLRRPQIILERVRELVKLSPQKRVLIEGITYKQNVADIRESASIKLAHLLSEAGLDVKYYDEIYDGEVPRLRRAKNRMGFDLLVLCVAHSKEKIEEYYKLNCPILDLTGLLQPASSENIKIYRA